MLNDYILWWVLLNISILSKKIQDGEDFYVSLLEKVIDNPTRYCGLFRLSNARTKLIQNVTQSREIKFGDIIEEICTLYIDKLGYKNFNKHLGKNENGDDLNVDQYFADGINVFLTEMKIREPQTSEVTELLFLPYEEALNLLTYETDKRILQKAHIFNGNYGDEGVFH